MVEMMLKLKDMLNFPEVLSPWWPASGHEHIQRILDGWHVEHRTMQPTQSHSLIHIFWYNVEIVFVKKPDLVKYIHD